MAVATAKQYGHFSKNFYYTNGERPFFLKSDGTKDYNRQVWSIHAGVMSIATNATLNDAKMCWYLDSYFCSGLHAFKQNFDNPNDARVVISLAIWICVAIAAIYLFCIKFHA